MMFEHTIVIGGGIAGLLAARVLATYSEHVTVLERDQYPDTPTFRPGTPQARQIHNMLLKGQEVLETLFPGFAERLIAQGARLHDFASDSLYFYGQRCPRLAPGLPGWNASRMLVEWQLRRELHAFPHIQVCQGCTVKGLLSEEQAIKGVTYQDQDQATQMLKGELVIDASGSSSASPIWLAAIGYQPAQETSVNPSIGYATRLYQSPEKAEQWWHGLAIQGTGENQRAGALMEIEGGQWMVLVAGSGQDYPPTDEEGYLAFAKSLPEPTLYHAVQKAIPLSKIYGYRPIGNRFRHYERNRMPRGFLVLGDAICTLNPIYGQGMTIAALQAQVLDRCLHSWQSRRHPTLHCQKQIAKVVASPWMLATTADAAAAHQKKKTFKERVADYYLRQHVIPMLPKNQAVERLFLEILNMRRPSHALLAPWTLIRVLGKHIDHSARHEIQTREV